MGKWILSHPVLAGVYFLIIVMMIIRFIGKPYVDYVVESRVNQKMDSTLIELRKINTYIENE